MHVMPKEVNTQSVSNAAPEVGAQTQRSRITRYAGVMGLSAMLALLGLTACDDGGGSGDESGAADEAGNEEEAGDDKGNEEDDEESSGEEEESGGEDGDEIPPEFKGKKNDNKEDKLDEAIEAGQELYKANACAGCHGDKGQGMKGIGSQLAKKDEPLADDYFLFRVMKGVEDTAMVGYESSLEAEDVWDILSFIRSHEK